MDISELLLPGVQNLLSTMLSDTWKAVHSALTRKHGSHEQDPDPAMTQISARLDDVRTAALAVTRDADRGGETGVQSRDAESFLAGYLYCLQQERPELAQIAASIATPASIGRDGSAVATGNGPAVVVHGDVGTSLAITEMSGDINIAGNG